MSSLATSPASATFQPSALWSRRCCIAAFLLLAMPLSLWFALRVPLGEVADEPAHLMRTASLLDGQLFGHRAATLLKDGRTVTAAGVDVDPVWEVLSRSREPSDVAQPAAPMDPAIGSRPAGARKAFFPLYTIATYCPVFYLPGAVGLGAATLLGFDARTATIVGRLAAVLAFAGLGIAALALARRGRMLLFLVLALPMTLSLAGSFNQDGLIIATAALAAALVTRDWDASGPLRQRRSLLAATGLIALIVLAKPPYAPLAVLLLLPLSRRTPLAGLAGRGGLAALAVLPGLFWTGYAMTHVGTPIPRDAYEAGPLWTGPRPAVFQSTDPAAQIHVLVEKPTRLVTVPAQFLGTIKHVRFMGSGAIGILGWLDRPLPGPLYTVWVLAFVAVASWGRARDLDATETSLLVSAALVCLWVVVLSQYVTWSNVGADRVDGPQGRYLLPILPLLVPLLAPNGRLAGTTPYPSWRHAVAAMPYLAAALSLALIPTIMRI